MLPEKGKMAEKQKVPASYFVHGKSISISNIILVSKMHWAYV